MDNKILTKYWKREYKINLDVKKYGAVFYNYFKLVLDKLNKTSMGISIDLNKLYSFKTFILWANKLRKLNGISDIQINEFFEFLETNNNNSKIEESDIHVPYTEAQEQVFNLANKHMEILKHALDNAVAAEKICFNQFMQNNPGEEADNCLWRIQEALKPILDEIDRCEPIDGKRASKMPKYKQKPRALTEKLQQTRNLI